MIRDADEHLRSILALHFNPEGGSAYWLKRQNVLGIDVRKEVRNVADLWKLGPMPLDDLRTTAVNDWVPVCLADKKRPLVYAETGGATGSAKATVYFEDEFEAIFVNPFMELADALGIGRGRWLWIGPGGPHVIGKAASAIAKKRSGMDPYAVDFDPRWYRRLAPGSLGRSRYMDHLIEQALHIFEREHIENIFGTPSVVIEMARRMGPAVRNRVQGMHLGGMAIREDALKELTQNFGSAVIIAGYGNTLFGVCHSGQNLAACPESIRYFPHGPRFVLKLVREEEGMSDAERIREEVGLGEEGQVMFHRLDESIFLANVLERDRGLSIEPNEEETRLGFVGLGIADPAPVALRQFTVDAGIY